MRIRFVLLLHDRPLSLRDLGVLRSPVRDRSSGPAEPLARAPGDCARVDTLTRRAQNGNLTAIHERKMIMTLQAGDKLMSLTDVSEMLGIPVHTLYRWRYKGDGPVGYRVGRHVRYRREAVEAWLEQQADPR